MRDRRMIRRPKVGDTVDVHVGPATVEEVRRDGLTLVVRDRIERTHTVTRSPGGWWTRLAREAVA